MRTKLIALLVILSFSAIYAQSTEEKLNVLEKEVEQLKAGKSLFKPVTSDKGKYGMGPAASKVYETQGGVSIGGYGEIVYHNPAGTNQSKAPSGSTDELDALRAILYFGYKFNDWIVFNSEIEIEHADEIFLEFSYLDFLLNDAFNIRAGVMLTPVGLVNELHEPILFSSVNRPQTEGKLIPSTWRAGGVGIFGNLADMFDYKLYVVNGFDGADSKSDIASGFTADGLRGGRQKVSNAIAEDFAGVARVDFVGVNGLLVGGSAYFGGSGQRISAKGNTLITEGHVDFRIAGAYLRGLVAWAKIDDAEAINASVHGAGSATNTGVAQELIGGYVEAGYDIFQPLGFTHKLILFGRYEYLDTQFVIAPGNSTDGSSPIVKDFSKARQVFLTFGANYKPIVNVVVKADFEIRTNGNYTGVNQMNLSTGYVF